MSVETERSSMESSAASGLDFEDIALTLRLPGSSSSSDPDRKRASTSDPDRRLGLSSLPQGPGGGVAASAVVREERAVGGGGVQGQVRQGGRRRRAVPAQGGPGGVRGLRPAPRRAPGQVLLPLHRPQGWERRDGARGRGERDGVRADVRGQGRGLDARRRRPLEALSFAENLLKKLVGSSDLPSGSESRDADDVSVDTGSSRLQALGANI